MHALTLVTTLPATPSPSASPAFAVRHHVLAHRTEETLQFIDVTDEIAAAVLASGVSAGMASVQSLHTTAAIVVNEHEPLLLQDLRRTLEAFAPRSATYRHDDFSVRTVNMEPGEMPNGHAHAKGLALTTSVTLAVDAGRLVLGRWQRIFLVELDRPRDRRVVVTVMGVTTCS